MKQAKINDLNYVERKISTSAHKRGVLDKLRQRMMTLINYYRATEQKVLNFQAVNGYRKTETDVDAEYAECEILEKEMIEAFKGYVKAYSTNEMYKGILPHGYQLSMFSEIYDEAGEKPAATHKGGAANAR